MNAHHQEVADVYVEDGIIVAVKPNIKVCFIYNTGSRALRSYPGNDLEVLKQKIVVFATTETINQYILTQHLTAR